MFPRPIGIEGALSCRIGADDLKPEDDIFVMVPGGNSDERTVCGIDKSRAPQVEVHDDSVSNLNSPQLQQTQQRMTCVPSR